MKKLLISLFVVLGASSSAFAVNHPTLEEWKLPEVYKCIVHIGDIKQDSDCSILTADGPGLACVQIEFLRPNYDSSDSSVSDDGSDVQLIVFKRSGTTMSFLKNMDTVLEKYRCN